MDRMSKASKTSEGQDVKESMRACSDQDEVQSIEQAKSPPNRAQVVDGRFDLNLLPREVDFDLNLLPTNVNPDLDLDYLTLPIEGDLEEENMQDQPPVMAGDDQPPVVDGQDEPLAMGGQGQPPVVAGQVQPPVVANQDQPLAMGGQDQPRRRHRMSTLERPEWLPNNWWYSWTIRQNGKCAGQIDKYYMSPEGRRFRSRKEVEKHLNANVVSDVENRN